MYAFKYHPTRCWSIGTLVQQAAIAYACLEA